MAERSDNSIFLIEVDKIKPNPFQPRREFNEDRLFDLAESIRQYGILQPLVVTRREIEREDGGLYTEYELIAGERRLRASRIAGLSLVPAIIRTGEQTDKEKLELAIIENLQREDLNPVDRAQAFGQLASEFGLKHTEIAKRIGKSREYVSNTVRILALPQEVLDAIVEGKISEGHTRPILMLADRPEEQMTLFRDIIYRKMTVREAERVSREIAVERARKKFSPVPPDIVVMEGRLTEKLGTRVKVEKRDENIGRITIDFFSPEELRKILLTLSQLDDTSQQVDAVEAQVLSETVAEELSKNEEAESTTSEPESTNQDDLPAQPAKPDEDETIYFIRDFTV